MDSHPCKLYVGNLDATVSHALLLAMFQQFGPCKRCQIIREFDSNTYAFVEFCSHESAAAAQVSMNMLWCMGKQMNVHWARSSSLDPKAYTMTSQSDSKYHRIFIGDLSPEVELESLRSAFRVFGEIADCTIIRDPVTRKSKGYGFILYAKKQDAENAIKMMNGMLLGSNPIRTAWAMYKTSAENTKQLSYEEVFNQSSHSNCTVHCCGIHNGLTKKLVYNSFKQFGKIEAVKVFRERGYAFIQFGRKEDAAHAIFAMHGSYINDQKVKCAWGIEPNDPCQSQQAGQQAGMQAGVIMQQPQVYGQYYLGPGAYWNGTGYASIPAYNPVVGANLAQQQYLQPDNISQWTPTIIINYQPYGSVEAGMQWGQPIHQPSQHQVNIQQQGLDTYPVQQ